LLYQCSAVHRYLRSFPTRRSSDLQGGADMRKASGLRPQASGLLLIALLLLAAAPAHAQIAAAIGKPLPAPDLPAGTVSVRIVAGDRKSTRLNSSHRTISYAVFCLK